MKGVVRDRRVGERRGSYLEGGEEEDSEDGKW